MRRIGILFVVLALGVPPMGPVLAEEAQSVLLVGADARSIVPDQDGDGVPDLDRIYLGGFGLGPYRVFDPSYRPLAYVGPENRPATGVHELGIWARTIAFANARGETVVVQSLDLQGYFLAFKGCDCGADAIRRGFQAATGIPASNLLVHATHQHAGPNVLGHQGGVPSWYLEQIRDTAIASAVAAVEALEPAFLGTGTIHAPKYHRHRRSTYTPAIDDTLVYLHATRPSDGGTIATLVNYSAHPTVLGSSNRIIHPDYPGPLALAIERELGGTAVYLNGGLGNVSPAAPQGADMYARAAALGEGIAALVVGDVERGTSPVRGDAVAAHVRTMEHPITNPVLLGGSAAHVYMRSDSLLTVSATPLPYPSGAVPVRVVTVAGGFRIGDAAVLFGPGEIFGAIASAAKSASSWASATMVSGLGNDHVGYIMQNHEYKVMQAQEYEETQSLDPWIGDHVLDVMLAASNALRAL
ncbi:MAG TPA: hypothetical protein VM600_01215 [Actinomycetota bacterium]|nr:hypothetical protein [Actinomycetota bacterium]